MGKIPMTEENRQGWITVLNHLKSIGCWNGKEIDYKKLKEITK